MPCHDMFSYKSGLIVYKMLCSLFFVQLQLASSAIHLQSKDYIWISCSNKLQATKICLIMQAIVGATAKKTNA